MGRKKTIEDARCPPFGGEREVKHIRKMRQCLLRYLASTGHPAKASTPDEESIRTFAEFQNLTITGDEKEWLVALYHSGTNEIIHKEDYAFYSTPKWRELRQWALDHYGRRCMFPNCKEVIESDSKLHIDHIKPKAKYPELAHDKNNVQVLCELHNRTKSDRGMKDYRPKELIPKQDVPST